MGWFCSIEFSSFKMKLLTSVPISSPGSLITPQATRKKASKPPKEKTNASKRKQLLSNLTLLVLISDLLHCCTDDSSSLKPQTTPSGFSVSTAWNAIRIFFASYKKQQHGFWNWNAAGNWIKMKIILHYCSGKSCFKNNNTKKPKLIKRNASHIWFTDFLGVCVWYKVFFGNSVAYGLLNSEAFNCNSFSSPFSREVLLGKKTNNPFLD